MFDAFLILGAKPSDNAEHLQELLEEKELISDDTSEAQVAYVDLTNPKKRLKHEIIHYCTNDFIPFKQLISAEVKASAMEHATVFVGLGHWFESDHGELLEKINNDRLIGGYSLIDDEIALFGAIEEIRHEFVMSANSYLDSLIKKESWVKIFNRIVQVQNFESFFIDELMAHYELVLGEVLQQKEKTCRKCFSEIEYICNDFNNGASLAPSVLSHVTKFEVALKDWDICAQPLQKNAQVRGGQHENSEKLVREIRNRLVELCNDSQAKLNEFLISFQNIQYGIFSLEQRLNETLRFVEVLITLTKALQQVFAELEITAEQLQDDGIQLKEIRKKILFLRNQIPGAEQRAYRSMPNNVPKTTNPSKSTTKPAAKWNGFRILLGIMTAICVILIIVGFSIENIAMGIAFIFLSLTFGVGSGAFYYIKSNKKALIAIILIPAILILLIVVPIACKADSGNNKKRTTLTTSNFESFFDVSAIGPYSGSNIYVDYSISLKSNDKSLYTNELSSDSIPLTIRVSIWQKNPIIGTHTISTLMGSKTIKISLIKALKYKSEGKLLFTLEKATNNLEYDIEIVSCGGTIYTFMQSQQFM